MIGKEELLWIGRKGTAHRDLYFSLFLSKYGVRQPLTSKLVKGAKEGELVHLSLTSLHFCIKGE